MSGVHRFLEPLPFGAHARAAAQQVGLPVEPSRMGKKRQVPLSPALRRRAWLNSSLGRADFHDTIDHNASTGPSD